MKKRMITLKPKAMQIKNNENVAEDVLNQRITKRKAIKLKR